MSKTIGALWKNKKQGEDNPVFLGNIEVIAGHVMNVAVFKNKKKTKDNQPDLNIVLNRPTENKEKQTEATKEEENYY